MQMSKYYEFLNTVSAIRHDGWEAQLFPCVYSSKDTQHGTKHNFILTVNTDIVAENIERENFL